MADQKQGMHHWQFFRSGGFDQVALGNGADLRGRPHLQPSRLRRRKSRVTITDSLAQVLAGRQRMAQNLPRNRH